MGFDSVNYVDISLAIIAKARLAVVVEQVFEHANHAAYSMLSQINQAIPMRTPKSLFSVTAFALTAVATSAFPIASPGTEGFPVVTAGGSVVATYQGNSAGYSNDLYLERNADGTPGMDGNLSNDLFIFNNHASPVGSVLALGTFAPGIELVFRLHVNNTGEDFYSGLAIRNPDGLPHARVQNNWQPGTTLVSFEDLFATPEGVNGYNDLSFSFTNTRNTAVPDGGATAFLLGTAFLGSVVLRRRLQQ